MYEFLTGPLVWIAFLGFAAGVIYQLVTAARLAVKERVVLPTWDAKHGLRSLLHWVIPFGGVNMRRRPFYTLISYAFHVSAIATPLLLTGHVLLVEEAWGVRWWTLPEGVADVMTLVVIFACLFFIVRRLVRPEVRNVTTPSDLAVAMLVLAPFATGFIAHQQWLPYYPMLIAHIISGAAALLLVPWTRLVHMIWFALTRSYMGSEFGAVRHARDW